MNKLDDKAIVDREVFVGILDMARRGLDSGFFGEVFYQDFAKGEQALAADLTGWAAVVVKPEGKMLDEAAGELPEYRPDDEEWDELDYEITSADRALAKATWNAMLEASPPLPGGGE